MLDVRRRSGVRRKSPRRFSVVDVSFRKPCRGIRAATFEGRSDRRRINPTAGKYALNGLFRQISTRPNVTARERAPCPASSNVNSSPPAGNSSPWRKPRLRAARACFRGFLRLIMEIYAAKTIAGRSCAAPDRIVAHASRQSPRHFSGNRGGVRNRRFLPLFRFHGFTRARIDRSGGS